MGLTIHYSFRSDAVTYREAKQQVLALREAALGAGFKEVGPLWHRKGKKACDPDACPEEERWLLIQAGAYLDIPVAGGACSIPVRPKEVVAFSTLPGPGCEPANFGLCRFPESITVPDIPRLRPALGKAGPWELPTRLKGWRWRSFCKTQYANDPQCGGVKNFLRCHLGVCHVLDKAQELGILHEVVDEGEYWERRDLEALAREVAHWDEFIAACVGQLKDQLAAAANTVKIGVAAPILSRPDFEHLEARGRFSGAEKE